MELLFGRKPEEKRIFSSSSKRTDDYYCFRRKGSIYLESLLFPACPREGWSWKYPLEVFSWSANFLSVLFCYPNDFFFFLVSPLFHLTLFLLFLLLLLLPHRSCQYDRGYKFLAEKDCSLCLRQKKSHNYSEFRQRGWWMGLFFSLSFIFINSRKCPPNICWSQTLWGKSIFAFLCVCDRTSFPGIS